MIKLLRFSSLLLLLATSLSTYAMDGEHQQLRDGVQRVNLQQQQIQNNNNAQEFLNDELINGQLNLNNQGQRIGDIINQQNAQDRQNEELVMGQENLLERIRRLENEVRLREQDVRQREQRILDMALNHDRTVNILTNQTIDLHNQLRALTLNYDGIRDNREALMIERANLINNHQGQVNGLNQQIGVLTGERDVAMGQRNAMQLQVGDLNEQLQAVTVNRDALIVQRDGLNNDIVARDAQILALTGQRDEAIGQRNALQVQVGGLNVDNADLNHRIGVLNAQIDQHVIDIGVIQGERDAAREQRDAHVVTIAERDHQIGLLTGQRNALQVERDNLVNVTIVELNRQIALFRDDRDNYKNQYEYYLNEHNRYKKAFYDEEKTTKTLSGDLQNIRQEVVGYGKEKEELKLALSVSQQESARKTLAINHLYCSLNSITQHNPFTTKEIAYHIERIQYAKEFDGRFKNLTFKKK